MLMWLVIDADELVASLREELAQSEQDGTWEPARVVLERMRGNPAARPASTA